jgi:hypothetical protein
MYHKNDPAVPISTLTDKTITVPITTTQSILSVQFISEPLLPRRFITSDTISVVIRELESALTANAHLAYSLRLLSGGGGTVRGTLDSRFTTSTEMAASAKTNIFNARALVAMTAQPGDILVFEVGAFASAPTAATTATQRFGNSATSDFALTAGLTTDLNPWVELSCNLYTPDNNNYRKIKTGDGVSSSGGLM